MDARRRERSWTTARERPGIELVLEDDRGRLPINAGAMSIALGGRRRTARSTAFHRAQALFGEMAGQALIAERDRQAHEG